jgi:hypothetical protein
MSRLFAVGLVMLVLADGAIGQGPPKDLQWTHAFDLACRKLGENEFTASTQKHGIEASRDLNLDLGLYVTENKSVALAAGFSALKPPVAAKDPVWITGLDLPARKPGEAGFTKTTKVYCLEIFRDPHTDNALFVTSDGNIATAAAKGKALGGNKAPLWVHAIDLSVRKGGVQDWKDAATIGIEIYRDGNTGNLIYISHTGAIAVLAELGETKVNDKAPAWLHGLDLSVRRANEPAFGKDVRKFGVELYRDETNGNLIYVAETGSIAVIAGSGKLSVPTEDVKEPVWSHGWNVKARKSGEKEFSERQAVGGEVFRDDNVGAILTISETGAISALRAK